MKPATAEVSNDTLLRAYESFDAMDAWGILRNSKEPLSATEVAQRLGITLQATQQALDLVEAAQLVKKLRAGAGRRGITYASVKDAMDVVLPRTPETEDEFDDWMAAVERHQDSLLGRMLPFAKRNRGGGDRYWRYTTELRATRKDWEELLRRGAAFTRFLQEIVDRMESPVPDGEELSRAHAVYIRVGPLSGPLKLNPLVRMRSDIAQKAIRAGRKAAPESLARREREIAALLQHGLSRGDIAQKLGISVETVSSHCKSFFKKLGIKRATELSRFSFEMGPEQDGSNRPSASRGDA